MGDIVHMLDVQEREALLTTRRDVLNKVLSN